MSEQFYNGMWWLPNSSDHKVMGVLIIYDDGKLKLKLNDSLFNANQRSSDTQKIEMVYGEYKYCNCSTPITLEELYGNELTLRYDVMRVIKAEYVHTAPFNPKVDLINSVSFSFDFLMAWLGGNEEYLSCKIIRFKLNNGNQCRLNIKVKATCDYTKSSNGNISTTQVAQCQVLFEQPLSFFELGEFISHMRMFLSIVRLKQIYYFDNVIIGFNDNHLSYSFNLYEFFLKANNTTVQSTFQLLFSYNQIKDSLDDILSNWFHKKEFLKSPIVQLYSSLSDSLYLEAKFINLVSGLESLHRNFHTNIAVKDEQLDRIINKLSNLTYKEKSQDIERVKSYNRNEINLRKRLIFILQSFKKSDLLSLDKLIGNSKKRDSFINKVVATRNWLIHYDHVSSTERKPFNIYEMQESIMILSTLLTFMILEKIGFRNEDLQKIWWNNRIPTSCNLGFNLEISDRIYPTTEEMMSIYKNLI